MDSEHERIEADTKDWTWVLNRPCPACGYDAAATPAQEVAGRLRAQVPLWQSALAGPAPRVRRRPSPAVWSVLEYACHVRDVCRVFDGRVTRMLIEDGPSFENWDQDATAEADDYPAQDPTAVSTELADAASVLADRFDAVPATAWDRPGHRSDGSTFTVESLSRYFLHDLVHHLHDIRR